LSKPLPLDDFRAIRIILEPDDFVLSSGEDPPPSDPVDKKTWHGITLLPDDVSVQTSNHHGSLLKALYVLWGAWLEALGKDEDPLYYTMMDPADEFQAATFSALNGYYRQAIGCLRSALEQVVIGAYFQICSEDADGQDFERWRSGEVPSGFDKACQRLNGAPALQSMNAHLIDTLGFSIFEQKTREAEGGWARRLYSLLSEYSHTRPGFTNFDMWNSNGPIYVPKAFNYSAALYLQTAALGFIVIKLGRPDFNLPQAASQVFGSEAEGLTILPMKIARVAYEYLFFGASTDRPHEN
jgi:hypothetical protein